MLTSPVEWGIVAAAALLLFGPKKFPELGRALGQGIGNFKKALTEAQEQVTQGIEETEGKTNKSADKAPAAVADKSGSAASSDPVASRETDKSDSA